MKRFFGLAALLIVSMVALSACSEDSSAVDAEELDVIPSNIEGLWSASEWNGHALEEGSYVYLNLIRKDCRYEIYQNVDSFSARVITGSYNIYHDEDLNCTVIRGDYDYGVGYWNHRYKVTSLTSDKMVWVSADGSLTTHYTRIDALPEGVGE